MGGAIAKSGLPAVAQDQLTVVVVMVAVVMR